MSVYAGDGEPVARWDSSVRRSKIVRSCCACCQPIAIGALYHRTAYLYDGDWEVIERCARCEAMYRILRPLVHKMFLGDEVCDDRLNCGHTWRDNFGEEPPVEVQALAFLSPEEAQVLLEKPLGFEWARKTAGLQGPVESEDAITRRLLARVLAPPVEMSAAE
jgi:hypothetical protein